MKKQLNKNLKSYNELESQKKDFRLKIMDETGWSQAKFYNALSGGLPPTKLEQQCLDKYFEVYQTILNHSKNYAAAN